MAIDKMLFISDYLLLTELKDSYAHHQMGHKKIQLARWSAHKNGEAFLSQQKHEHLEKTQVKLK